MKSKHKRKKTSTSKAEKIQKEKEGETPKSTMKRGERMEDIDFYNEEMFELVNIEYIITYKTTYDGDETRYHRAKGFLRNVNKMCVDTEIDDMTEHYCTVSLYPTVVESKTFKTSPIPTQVNDLVHERMFGVAVQYHFFPVEPNDSNTKECVYQYLLSRYGAYLKTLTKEKLMKIFDEENSTKGVSTAQIIKFCKKHNISCYALDLEMNVFHRHKPENPSHKLPTLVYLVANKHLYPIVDEAARNSIFACERDKSSKVANKYWGLSNKTQVSEDIPVVINPEFDEIKDLKDTAVVMTYLTSLLDVVLYFYEVEGVIYATESHRSIITKIKYKNGVVIYLNEDYDKVLNDCKQLSIPFKFQSTVQLVNEAFNIYSRDDKIHSTFNSESRKVFFEYTKSPFTFSNYVPIDMSLTTAVDINKCYSSCISSNNTEDWCVFSIFDEIKPYKGTLKPGFFYVLTDNYFPLKLNGWYSCGILKYCKSIGIEFKVVYELTPSDEKEGPLSNKFLIFPRDYFNEFVDRIYNKCDDNVKFYINSLVGCWYKKSSQKQKARYTSSINDAVRYVFSSEDSAYFCHSVEGKPDLYEILINQTQVVHDNLIPFHFQTDANMAAHKLYMKLGGKLVSVRTDCVVCETTESVEYSDEIGGYRYIENVKELPKVKLIPENNYNFKLSNREWEDDSGSVNRLLTGMAGTGKSYKIKEDLKKIDNYALTATTNRAARLVGGITIHSLLGLRIESGYDKKQIIKIGNAYDYIIIDEIGLLNEAMFEIIYFLKVNTKIKLILVGDDKQLLPIQDKKYKKQRRTISSSSSDRASWSISEDITLISTS